jgi:hypothetical protein
MFLTIIGGLIFNRVLKLGNGKNFIKGIRLLKQRRKFTWLSIKKGNRVALAEFTTTLPEERTTNKK